MDFINYYCCMKLKSTLLTAYLSIMKFIVFAQGNDQYGGAVNADADGEPPGPFTKYGWIIIIGGLIYGMAKDHYKKKKL